MLYAQKAIEIEISESNYIIIELLPCDILEPKPLNAEPACAVCAPNAEGVLNENAGAADDVPKPPPRPAPKPLKADGAEYEHKNNVKSIQTVIG